MTTRLNHLITFPECRACGSTRDVVVHHLRYRGKRGESEVPGDLVTLCSKHHDDFHRTYPKGSLPKNTLAYIEMVWGDS